MLYLKSNRVFDRAISDFFGPLHKLGNVES